MMAVYAGAIVSGFFGHRRGRARRQLERAGVRAGPQHPARSFAALHGGDHARPLTWSAVVCRAGGSRALSSCARALAHLPVAGSPCAGHVPSSPFRGLPQCQQSDDFETFRRFDQAVLGLGALGAASSRSSRSTVSATAVDGVLSGAGCRWQAPGAAPPSWACCCSWPRPPWRRCSCSPRRACPRCRCGINPVSLRALGARYVAGHPARLLPTSTPVRPACRRRREVGRRPAVHHHDRAGCGRVAVLFKVRRRGDARLPGDKHGATARRVPYRRPGRA